jgi:hypothetical protein
MPNLGRKPDNKPMGTAAALMVDQVWLWMLDDGIFALFKKSCLRYRANPRLYQGTVVTCSPDACDTRAGYNLKVILRDAIKTPNRTRTMQDFVELIISKSVDFFARPGPQGATFVGCFQHAINHVVSYRSASVMSI